MDHTNDTQVYGSIVRKITLLHVLAILLAAKAVLIVASYKDARRHKTRQEELLVLSLNILYILMT